MKREMRTYGGISGFVLKLARQSVPVSQEAFAESMGVDSTTIQSWESGRRPIAAAPMMQARRLHHHLLRLGADSGLVATLPVAVEADLVVTAIANPPTDKYELGMHPLAGCVMDLRLSELLAWALAGVPARFATRLCPVRRRGPTPTRPELGWINRDQLQSNLSQLSHGHQVDPSTVLLHSQARFLAGLSGLEIPERLSRQASRYLTTSDSWSPMWVEARSFAVARAYTGDREPLRDFIANAQRSDDCETAALTYTAYWVGDVADREGDGSFMVRNPQRWRGANMYPHLVERLDPEHPLVDLNTHNLWLLLKSQPGLIIDDRQTSALLHERIAQAADSDRISEQSRQELQSMAHSLSDHGPHTRGRNE